MEHELSTARNLLRTGKHAQAREILDHLLNDHPDEPRALHLRGMVASQSGQLAEGAAMLARAVELAPQNPEFIMSLGEIHARMGKPGHAIESFRRAVALNERNPQALYNLSLALATQSKLDEAIDVCRRALALQPIFPEALNNLGLMFHNSQRFDEAADCFTRALAQKPDYVKAFNNLGQTRWRQDRIPEAFDAYSQAVRLAPTFAPAVAGAAFALRRLGRRQEAAAGFKRAAELNPSSFEVHQALGLTLLDVAQPIPAIAACKRALELAPPSAKLSELWSALAIALSAAAKTDPGRTPEAVAAYDAALELEPDRSDWQFSRAALLGQNVQRAPDSFVKALFDQYAPRFEDHLVKGLQYRVPDQLHDTILELRPDDRQKSRWDVLDLGCGTGLCGVAFRAEARRMIGVDLSPKMVEVARARTGNNATLIYDEVYEDDVLVALRRYSAAFDLILAGDVFVYIGALDDIVPAARNALKPGGLLAYSLEFHDGEGYILNRANRFAHSRSYIANLTDAAGMQLLSAERHQMRADVPPGWLIVAQKSM